MSIKIDVNAELLLRELAAKHRVSKAAYLHALLHYAGSCEKRPGSWEANRGFAFASYDDRRGIDGRLADRWFRLSDAVQS